MAILIKYMNSVVGGQSMVVNLVSFALSFGRYRYNLSGMKVSQEYEMFGYSRNNRGDLTVNGIV